MTQQDTDFINEQISKLKKEMKYKGQTEKYEFVIQQATNLLEGKEVDIDGLDKVQMINPHVVGHIALTAIDYQ